MSDRQSTELDNQITAITADFAKRLDAIATMPSLRAGLLEAALSDLFWTLYHEMPDLRDELAKSLEDWPETIRDAITNDRG